MEEKQQNEKKNEVMKRDPKYQVGQTIYRKNNWNHSRTITKVQYRNDKWEYFYVDGFFFRGLCNESSLYAWEQYV